MTEAGRRLKTGLNDLAVLGGESAFSEPVHVGRPNVGNRERFLRRVTEMLDRNWLTNNGPFLQEFEQKLADSVGVPNCVVMCNATISLEIAIRALGLTGEVIVPSFTFVATAHALQWQEITPVFCDIDPLTHNIDPEQVEKMITPRTSGIIGVHTWGRACNIDALESIARRRNLQLMFDAAHAFRCSYKGRRIGGFGRCEVFSFHATKFFNSFEGGAVLTNDVELANKMRLMRNFGFQGYDNVIYLGTNGKMTEVCAAMGLTSLESVEEFIEINRRNYLSYQRELETVPGVNLLSYGDAEEKNYHYIVGEVDEARAGLTASEIVRVLFAENVLARRYFSPGCHRMEPYRSFFPHASLMLPQTERLCEKVIVLPNGSSVDADTVSRICNIIRLATAHPAAVRAALCGQTATQSVAPVSAAGSGRGA
jgi:dTDP-4-amino-4,6-dideoxygalactose transaminase